LSKISEMELLGKPLYDKVIEEKTAIVSNCKFRASEKRAYMVHPVHYIWECVYMKKKQRISGEGVHRN
jgi:hypothetical protein